MQIADIKALLTIQTVLSHYNLTSDKNNRLNCPWHPDKTPSLQIYPKTNTWTCFSSNCDAGSGDVIEFIKNMEKSNKHEAIKKAKVMIGHTIIQKQIPLKLETVPLPLNPTNPKDNLDEVFTKLKSNYKKSTKAQAYASSRAIKDIEIGYNATAWPHLKHCIIFPLKNKKGKIVSLYGRSIMNNDNAKHYYLKNRTGLYPSYPDRFTKQLILTESIIDSLYIKNVLAMYGTNGLTIEHVEAIKSLTELEEVILFFDGDEAGRAAIDKVSLQIKAINEHIKISAVDTPDGEDINSLLQGHNVEYLTHLIDNRTILYTDDAVSTSSSETATHITRMTQATHVTHVTHTASTALDKSNKHNLKYRGVAAKYSIKGGIARNSLDAMKITLVIEVEGSHKKSRTKLDLYEDRQVEKISKEAGSKLSIEPDVIEKDLNRLTDLLDEYRTEIKEETKTPAIMMTAAERAQCMTFLKKDKLIKNIDKLIAQSGVVGEENNRIFLFCIAAAHKMPNTLHALVQGSSASGKTHLLKQITNLMPSENVIRLTRVTESSFYNYGELELRGKLIVIEDYDGLKEEAEYAFRELQSNEEIISSTSVKDERSGDIKAMIRKVKGPIGSLSATTRSEIYEDNLSRCFVIAVDESADQTHRIIKYQNEVAAGEVDQARQEKVVNFLSNCMRLLKPMKVINPYASNLNLPPSAFKIRRLNSNFQSFIRQVTLINQYQRKKDNQGRLITQLEDIKIAVEIMFDSILLKVDELDGGLRLFYERIKKYVTEKAKENDEKPNLEVFTQREIRHNLRVSKTSLQRYINDLVDLDYVQQIGLGFKKSHQYKITYWDNIEKMRKEIKAYLNDQIDRLN